MDEAVEYLGIKPMLLSLILRKQNIWACQVPHSEPCWSSVALEQSLVLRLTSFMSTAGCFKHDSVVFYGQFGKRSCQHKVLPSGLRAGCSHRQQWEAHPCLDQEEQPTYQFGVYWHMVAIWRAEGTAAYHRRMSSGEWSRFHVLNKVPPTS